ncbi:hypothetical protein FSP39_020474 [Pinctada imbricata]|uniref:Homeobox domain-containing protein n=1 Tax=Pinctada imbricata TaxID=66713 RepID=A0AA88XLM9_PINIB|nr:hypothetical protein FSP39_020474 [Pinctada imbricata]
MSLSQVAPFPVAPGSATSISSSIPTSSGSRACCENGRPIMTDPHTGQTVCSCQYNPALLGYARVPGIPEGLYGAGPYGAQGLVPFPSEGSAFYSPLTGGPFDVKEATEAWRNLTQPGGCYPYDPAAMAMYPYGPGYGGIDLNARRKNATRETTNTLKAWLYEHRKNPYPTKGEKIMLAIITKMTLTQVSTWFANARRRLKKENKMTWSPRNRSEDDGDNDDSDNDNDDDMIEKNNESAKVDRDRTSSDAESGKEETRIDQDISLHGEREKIINVDDDDDSNLSFRPLSSDLEKDDDISNSDSDSNCPNILRRDADVNSPSTSIGDESRYSQLASPSNPCSADKTNNKDVGESSAVESSSPTRAKIWSVSQFLNSDEKDNKNKEPEAEMKRHSAIITRPLTLQNGGSDLFYMSPANNHFLRTGRYGGFGPYASSLSLSHTTLSYPYILSSHSAAKSSLASTYSSFSDAENLTVPKSVTGDKLRPDTSLFSPARDLDVVRNGSKF